MSNHELRNENCPDGHGPNTAGSVSTRFLDLRIASALLLLAALGLACPSETSAPVPKERRGGSGQAHTSAPVPEERERGSEQARHPVTEGPSPQASGASDLNRTAPGCPFDALIVGDGSPDTLGADFDCGGLKWVGATPLQAPGLGGYCRLPLAKADLGTSVEVLLERASAAGLPAGFRAAPDCRVVRPASPPPSAPLGPPEPRQYALDAAGRVYGRARFGGERLEVHVVADPAAEAILRELGCVRTSSGVVTSTGTCAYRVSSAPWARTKGPRSLSELAEVLATRLPPAASEPTVRSVVHLGWGWNGDRSDFTNLRTGTSPSMGAVLRALRVLACQGVVVVSASGDARGLVADGRQSAWLPAAWSTTTTPDSEMCRAWLKDRPTPDLQVRPLLLSAGTVGAALARPPRWEPGAPGITVLAVQRQASLPNVIAWGEFPAGGDEGRYVGSSAAAAVLAASVAWMRVALPQEEPGQLIEELVRAARPLRDGPRVTLPWAVASSPQLHWTRPCETLRETCGDECPFDQGAASAEGLRCASLADRRSPSMPAAAEHTLNAGEGPRCPKALRVRVFADLESDRKGVCERFAETEVSLESATTRACRRCGAWTRPGTQSLRVLLDLTHPTLRPAYLEFRTPKEVGLHRLPPLAPGQRHVIDVALPGPVPRKLTGRLILAGESGVAFQAEAMPIWEAPPAPEKPSTEEAPPPRGAP